jgi:signal transduction histidine kinase
MSKQHPEPAKNALRRRAEDRLRRQPAVDPPGTISQAESQRLVHQLQVHQIELEMQNETLHQARGELETLAARQAAHLRELAGDLTRAEQHERDRLHGLLHDEVQPLLVAARLSLSGLGAHSAREDCLRVAAEACEHLGQAIRMTRELSLQLNPPLIRERGLNAALASLCGWVRENHGLIVELSGAADAEPGDTALRLLCFNAIRELLLNVVKHAGTARVALTLQRCHDGFLRITVVDHGYGFDPDAISGGSGLAAIERRLGMIGGVLHIDSRPGQGTVATLKVPLDPVTVDRRKPGAGRRRNVNGKRDAQDPDYG